jgi:hypothetical protein
MIWWDNLFERRLVEYLYYSHEIDPDEDEWHRIIVPEWYRYCVFILNKTPQKITDDDLQRFVNRRPEIFDKYRQK